MLFRRINSAAPRRTARRAAMLSVVVVQAWGRGSGDRSSASRKRRGARIGMSARSHVVEDRRRRSRPSEPGRRAAARWAVASRRWRARACERSSPRAWIPSRSRRWSANRPPPTIRTTRSVGRDREEGEQAGGPLGPIEEAPAELDDRRSARAGGSSGRLLAEQADQGVGAGGGRGGGAPGVGERDDRPAGGEDAGRPAGGRGTRRSRRRTMAGAARAEGRDPVGGVGEAVEEERRRRPGRGLGRRRG